PANQARPLAVMILCALLCSTLAIAFGVLGALTYAEQVKEVAGLTLQHLRPLHTSFAVAWIYLAGVAVVYFFLFAQSEAPPRGFRLRLKGQLILWGVAGGGILVSLCQGVFSGREYLGAHWSWSILIYLGWILFAWNFFSVVGFNLRGKPVFVYMWYTAILLFLWTFAEGHGWHLALVSDYPLRDIAVQWKSYGPLVGSFNLLVYGAMGYLGCCVAGNMNYARSNTAFALFFVGVINSFVNFGHHTYHLPEQSLLVKWISVIASLAEAVLAFKYMLDIAALLRSRQARPGNQGVNFIVTMVTIWSFILVSSSVIISIPPVNTLIHGTHFVMAHAMGAMLGVDSMALWAVLLYIIQRSLPADHRLTRKSWTIPLFALLNVAIICLVCVLATKGVISGYLRYMGPAAPAVPRFMTLFPSLFMACGFALAVAILFLNVNWMVALLPVACKSRRRGREAPVDAHKAAP
ncbi:MAG: cbb3-type cytochrome c oxidase subunit I, partial [Planctomycetes bacterium]|nr:cbb3-type cytochrome c oxidase subunit I [Planctomycetota bacterium]